MTKDPTSVPSFSMPLEAFDESFVWDKAYKPTPVFLKQLKSHSGAIDLFAVLFEVSRSNVDGNWKFQEYVASYRTNESQMDLHFRQYSDGVMFTPKGIKVVDVPADRKKSYPLLKNLKPGWKWSDGYWPEFENEPMTFVGQARAHEDQGLVAVNIYLFSSKDDGALAIFTQRGSYQSAEEHYNDEASRM